MYLVDTNKQIKITEPNTLTMSTNADDKSVVPMQIVFEIQFLLDSKY